MKLLLIIRDIDGVKWSVGQKKKYLPRQSAQVENLVKTCHDIVN